MPRVTNWGLNILLERLDSRLYTGNLDPFPVCSTAQLVRDLADERAETARLRARVEELEGQVRAGGEDTKEVARLKEYYRWRPVSEAHEDFGDCVYIDIEDPGYQVTAHVCDDCYEERILGMTHFARLPELTEAMAAEMLPAPPAAKEGGAI